MRDAADNRLVTCVLIKPNQAGTVSETLAAVEAAQSGGLSAIISARSGESEDVTIAHLATGWNTGQLKVGSIARGERTAKWNELLRIAEALAGQAAFAGWDGLSIRTRHASCPRTFASSECLANLSTQGGDAVLPRTRSRSIVQS